MSIDPAAEYKKRLTHLRGQLAGGEAKASVDRAALEGGTVDPRPRGQIERELETFERFDGPMLRDEIEQAERALAALEASQQTERPPLAILVPRGDPTSKVEQLRRQLAELHLQRDKAVTREMDLLRAVGIVVAAMRDFGDERRRHREAVEALKEINREIGRVGAEILGLEGVSA
jgi:hypothetical protein